jgi:signal peptidase I
MFRSSKPGRIVIGVLLVLAIFVGITKAFFVNYYRLPQNGMYPTIKKDGYVFARLHAYGKASDVKRGDVIIFKQVEQEEQIIHICRVVGIPGDTIDVLGETVRVNGEALKREQVRNEGKLAIYREHNGKSSYEIAVETPIPISAPADRAKVKPDQVYVLGDNRFDAVDSRNLGPIMFDTILGKKI